MTSDLMRALTISGAILLGVVILIIIVSMVAVRRGELEMAEDARQQGRAGHH